MKTVIIYDQLEANLTFIVLDGDYRHLDKVYINQCFEESKAEQKAREKLQDELNDLIYPADGEETQFGYTKVELLEEFPTQAVLDGAFVIVAGFLP